jgi:hypothetical protein
MLPTAPFAQPSSLESSKATYSAGIEIAGSGMAASATDFFQILGAAGKTIKVTRVEVTADATAAGTLDIYLYKRTAVNTGGTVAAVTGIAHDSQDPTYSAVVQTYSVNASPLGAGQIIRTVATALPAASSTGYPFSPTIWHFGVYNDKIPTLRGAAESLCLNLGGASLASGLIIWVSIEWTEE